LILAVGFDQSRHGFINPCQDLLDDKFATQREIDDEKGYKPKQFFPSNPYDPLAGLCNVMLELENNMFTEERQIIEDQMVVEFRYDIKKPGLWKWIPMRVRYDKTADFRANQGVSRKGGILIDFACGKGGDFPKWIAAGLSFVFGIDISKDN